MGLDTSYGIPKVAGVKILHTRTMLLQSTSFMKMDMYTILKITILRETIL